MKKIRIQNFGPIREVDLTLDKQLTVLIGPQASGKSTFSKIIYFCRKTREYFFDYANMVMNQKAVVDHELYINYLKYLRNRFMGFFGTTKHMAQFRIQYSCNVEQNKMMTVSLGKDGYALFQFSSELEKDIHYLLEQISGFMDRIKDDDMMEAYDRRNIFNDLLRKQLSQVFCDDEKLIYIPAGRNMLSVLSESINVSPGINYGEKINIEQTDLITQEFITHIGRIKSIFGYRLDDITRNYVKTVQGQIKTHDVNMASELIRQILKGDYVNERDGERLYYDEDHWVKMIFASSGQQEILWALNIIYLAILRHEKTFLVFEEPESHLFPEAQELIARLIALMIHSSRSEVLITTHSPYMLTSFNTLILSSSMEKQKTENSIIEKQCRLSKRDIAAYGIGIREIGEPGVFTNIVGGETGMIDATQIDHISNRIYDIIDQLMELESDDS